MASRIELGSAERAVVAKAARRLIPFMALLYFFSFLDRVNVGFAALTMNEDIGLSASAYGFGAGIFFLGYFLFEVPSNIILHKVGARRWIARIMISWGLISAATAFVTGPVSFWIVRFLLGLAEAGFFPGMILYMTYWFPSEVRGRVMASFLVAIPLSSAIGAPLSTALLGLNVFGLEGWQSMFILEGVPAVLLGLSVLTLLPNGPAEAKFLSSEERATIAGMLERERAEATHSSLRSGLTQPEVWRLAIIYLGLVTGLYGYSFWAPQMIKSLGELSNFEVGLIAMIPFGIGAVTMRFWATRSDRKNERRFHLAAPAALGGAAFIGGALAPSPIVTIVMFVAAAAGIYATLPIFWTLPTRLLSGTAAAGGIALINSVGNLGGYIGPFFIGWVLEVTGDHRAGLVGLGSALIFAALLVFLQIGKPPARR